MGGVKAPVNGDIREQTPARDAERAERPNTLLGKSAKGLRYARAEDAEDARKRLEAAAPGLAVDGGERGGTADVGETAFLVVAEADVTRTVAEIHEVRFLPLCEYWNPLGAIWVSRDRSTKPFAVGPLNRCSKTQRVPSLASFASLHTG